MIDGLPPLAGLQQTTTNERGLRGAVYPGLTPGATLLPPLTGRHTTSPLPRWEREVCQPPRGNRGRRDRETHGRARPAVAHKTCAAAQESRRALFLPAAQWAEKGCGPPPTGGRAARVAAGHVSSGRSATCVTHDVGRPLLNGLYRRLRRAMSVPRPPRPRSASVAGSGVGLRPEMA